MKKLMLVVVALVLLVSSCSTYTLLGVTYRKQVFQEIEEILGTDTRETIDFDKYVRWYPDFRGDNIFDVLYYNKQKEIFMQGLSKYKDIVLEHNNRASEHIAMEQAKLYLIQSYKEQVYKELVVKYSPSEYKQLTKEQQQKFLLNIVGERAIYKHEWDLMISQYHVLASRSVSEARADKGEVKIKEALIYLMAQEALWYFGYTNRWTDNIEYSVMLDRIKNMRVEMILYVEGKDIMKDLQLEN